jgi:hypothetical protein
LVVLQIPSKFVDSFGPIPGRILVLTNIGCKWRMTTKFDDPKAIIDQGWAAFAIAHDLKIGYVLTFRKEAPGVYRVVIFDYTYTEVMPICPDHGNTTRLVVEEEDVGKLSASLLW